MKQADAFWNATAEDGLPVQRLQEPLTCDVAVVGGGFTGLRAALMLAEAGVDVALFEAGDIANGASGRSGGQVNPMLPVASPAELRQAVGSAYFERLADAALRSADDLFDLVKTYQIRCEARQLGWLRADHSASARTTARRNAKLWNEMGAAFEFVDGDSVAKLTGARGYASGTINTRGGAVQPLALARGLHAAANAAGARVFGGSPVRSLKLRGKRWMLGMNGFEVAAEKVIIATNGYTDALVPGLKQGLLPLTSIQIATGPLPPERLEQLCPQGHTISDTRRLIMYCRKEPGGQFIYGGIGFQKPFGGIGGWSWLYRDAARIFPALKGVTWRYRWGGRIALTPDRIPQLSESQPGLIAGLGYNGRGVAMSLVMGREMARRALGVAPDQLPFPMRPLQRYPFRTSQFIGAGLAMGYWRALDQIEMRRG